MSADQPKSGDWVTARTTTGWLWVGRVVGPSTDGWPAVTIEHMLLGPAECGWTMEAGDPQFVGRRCLWATGGVRPATFDEIALACMASPEDAP